MKNITININVPELTEDTSINVTVNGSKIKAPLKCGPVPSDVDYQNFICYCNEQGVHLNSVQKNIAHNVLDLDINNEELFHAFTEERQTGTTTVLGLLVAWFIRVKQYKRILVICHNSGAVLRFQKLIMGCIRCPLQVVKKSEIVYGDTVITFMTQDDLSTKLCGYFEFQLTVLDNVTVPAINIIKDIHLISERIIDMTTTEGEIKN